MIKRQHSTKVKAAIALEAIKGEKTIAEISKHHNVHPSRIHAWKAEALKGLEGIFNANKSEATDERSTGQAPWYHGRLKSRTSCACPMSS